MNLQVNLQKFFAVLLLLRMRQNVRFKICRLRKLFVASVERTDVGSVPCMNPDMRPQVEVQGESLPAALEGALEGLLARVHQLMSLQLGAFDKSLQN